MKKFISIILAIFMISSLCACSTDTKPVEPTVAPVEPSPTEEVKQTETLKLGLICLHDSNSPYDANFIKAFKSVCENAEVEYLIKENVAESSEAYDAACELADSGCNLVFGDSFGFEDYMIQASKEFPDVEFCHATGTKAHTEKLPNFHNAFASIYEGRYLDGVAAGLKLKEMNFAGDVMAGENIVGYVGAYPYAEVISGYTAFYLGVKSVAPTAKMKVIYTGSWYDETLEKEAANALIKAGCVLISGHADSMGVPNACEAAGVPFVFYNGSVVDTAPNTFIVATKINWAVYFEYVIDCLKNGTPIATDWVGTLIDGAVEMTEINNPVAAEGTDIALADAINKLRASSIKVFNVNNFTVNGEIVTTYKADVDSDPNYEGDTEAIIDDYFAESVFRSAPYFDMIVDNIEILG